MAAASSKIVIPVQQPAASTKISISAPATTKRRHDSEDEDLEFSLSGDEDNDDDLSSVESDEDDELLGGIGKRNTIRIGGVDDDTSRFTKRQRMNLLAESAKQAKNA